MRETNEGLAKVFLVQRVYEFEFAQGYLKRIIKVKVHLFCYSV